MLWWYKISYPVRCFYSSSCNIWKIKIWIEIWHMRIFKKITIEDFLCSHMIGIHIPRLKGYNHYIHKYCMYTYHSRFKKKIAANNVRVVLFLKMYVGQILIQIFFYLSNITRWTIKRLNRIWCFILPQKWQNSWNIECFTRVGRFFKIAFIPLILANRTCLAAQTVGLGNLKALQKTEANFFVLFVLYHKPQKTTTNINIM